MISEIDARTVTSRLDGLMKTAGLDAVLVTSPHNVRYMLGGLPFFFFEHDRAFGRSQYLPIVVYPRGRPEDAYFVGYVGEDAYWIEPPWLPSSSLVARGTADAMEEAVRHLQRCGVVDGELGIEAAFLPADAYDALRAGAPRARVHDTSELFDELRARKSGEEVAAMRSAAERVLAAMLEVFAGLEPGMSKRDVVETLRHQEAKRGLDFKYGLIAAGSDLNRAPSSTLLREGDIVSIDSGGSFRGYVGDIARMGILGEPDEELERLLGEVDELQRVAVETARAGASAGAIAKAVAATAADSPSRAHLLFEAHGMGLVGHEGPAVVVRSGRIELDRDSALEPGMILSIETAIRHPRRGFVKLEDALVVTAGAPEVFAPGSHGWNVSAATSAGAGDDVRGAP